jgi:NADPH-dependent glutamate synthase beta subunit-like oxidoreductase
VILGGETLAAQVLEKAREAGAERLTFIFRKAPDAATAAVLSEAGARVLTGVGVTRLFGEGEALTGIEVRGEADGQVQMLDARTLVFSAGRFPELVFTRPAEEEESDASSGAWIATPPYKQPANAGEVGLFAKGDALTDFSGAIRAIGAGRRAAATIHMLIYDIPLDLPENVIQPDTVVQNVDHVEAVDPMPRQIMPLGDSRELTRQMELEKGFDTAAAKAEADRCLRCGLICYQNAEKPHPSEQIRDAVNA